MAKIIDDLRKIQARKQASLLKAARVKEKKERAVAKKADANVLLRLKKEWKPAVKQAAASGSDSASLTYPHNLGWEAKEKITAYFKKQGFKVEDHQGSEEHDADMGFYRMPSYLILRWK